LKYKIFQDDHPILKKKCEEVSKNTENLQDMIDTLKHALFVDYKKTGAGLAGNQIGFSYQILAINFRNEEQNEKHLNEIWINPKIIWSSKKSYEMFEGCLSYPNILVPVIRPSEVKIEAFNEKFEKKVFRAKDFYARVFQHEIDHLNGITFLDRASDLSRIKKIKK